MTEMAGQDVQARLKILHILWAALGAAIIVYGVVAHVVTPLGSGEDPKLSVLRLAFAAVSIVTAAVTFWWRRSFAVRPGGELSLFLKEPGVPLSSEERATVLERLQVNCIIVWALSESVGIYGLVLAILSGDPNEFMPFGCGALALLMLHRPAMWPISRSLGTGTPH